MSKIIKLNRKLNKKQNIKYPKIVVDFFIVVFKVFGYYRVEMKILHMDERFRCINNHSNIYKSQNNFSVNSLGFPELRSNTIFLRGTEELDNRIASIIFKQETEAKKYIKNVIDALKDWAVNSKAWNIRPIKQDPYVNKKYLNPEFYQRIILK